MKEPDHSEYKDLRFGFQTPSSDPYTHSTNYKFANSTPSNFYHTMLSEVKHGYASVSTQLSWRKHALMIDCDDNESMIAAAHWIKTIMEQPYVLVESSPESYWIILAQAYTLKDARTIAREIPGNDEKYLNFMHAGMPVVRALPKKGIYPVFPNGDQLSAPVAKWYNQLIAWYNSKALQTIVYRMSMVEHLKNGTISQIAANPQFNV